MRRSEEAGNRGHATSLQHILAELERVDMLIRARVWRARQLQAADEQFLELVISGSEVDALMAKPPGLPRWATSPAPLSLAGGRAAVDQIAAGIAQHSPPRRRG